MSEQPFQNTSVEDAAAQAAIGTPAQESAQPMPQGSRNEGVVPLPNGNTVVHEVTADGMKQSRIVGPARGGPSHTSAAEFHVAKGIATQGEVDHVNGNTSASKPSLVRRALGKLGIGK